MTLITWGVDADGAALPEERWKDPSPVPPVPAPFAHRPGDVDDGRVVADLRRHARRGAAHALAFAVARWREDPRWARAAADLAASGRRAARDLVRLDPAEVEHLVAGLEPHLEGLAERLEGAIDHARAVLRYLSCSAGDRAGQTIAWENGAPRWIAVSGEDDPPLRPVNVGASCFPAIEVAVPLPAAGHAPAAGEPGCVVRTRALVAGEPERATAWLLYLHGGGSRAEECERLAEALVAHEDERLVVVAPDLPGCGYCERVPCDALGIDVARPLPLFREAAGPFPFLDMLDAFVEGFVPRLREAVPALERRPLAAVVGGSLGGNLALRAALNDRIPCRAHVAWSPASIWGPLTDPLRFKDMAPSRALALAAWTEREHPAPTRDNDARRRYFWQTFEDDPPFVPPAWGMWWDADFAGRLACRDAALNDRREVYDEHHRRFAWRCSYEQLYFSWQEPHEHPRARRIPRSRPVMLLAGDGDDFPFSNIYSRVREIGHEPWRMPAARRVVLVGRTGHSLHDERPRLLAHEILAFLASLDPQGRRAADA